MNHVLLRIAFSLGLAAHGALQAPAAVIEGTAIPAGAPPAMASIRKDRLLEHAEWLASDDRQGRLTAMPGQVEAAEYIAAHFAKLKLEPLGDAAKDGKRSWLQSFPLTRTYLDPQKTVLTVAGETFTGGFAVLPGTASSEVKVKGPWRLVDPAGTVPELGAAIPVVVIKTPALAGAPADALFSSALTVFNKTRGIARKLEQRGAKVAVFAITGEVRSVGTVLNYAGLAPGKDLLTMGGENGGMAGMAESWKGKIPQVFLAPELATKVLAALGAPEAAGDSGGKAAPAKVQGELGLRVAQDPKAHAVNVVGLLRGSDKTLAKEAIVYSAHMDHVGVRFDGDVFNGADDNASGTAGLMEIAAAYAAMADKPKRSVVFLAVAGEELGLWGSAWFSDHPTWKLDDIVANINTDMIGRSGPESDADQVTVTPSYRHGMFSTIVRDSAALGGKLGLSFTDGDKYYTRSDHYNFAEKGIPVVFFCSGEHPDYHQVSDSADKLDGTKMEKIARLAFWTGVQVANAKSRPQTLGRATDWQGTGAGEGGRKRQGKGDK